LWSDADRKTAVLEERPVPVPLYPPQTSKDWPGTEPRPLNLVEDEGDKAIILTLLGVILCYMRSWFIFILEPTVLSASL
jgi:hypothetical protein